jgi:GNAT superfamily N-acetyltransferase
MKFELTTELIDDILFSMESQDGDFCVDTRKGRVSGGDGDVFDEDEDVEDGADEEGRYIDLPEWDSAAGFALMEHFTAGLRNPPARKALAAALDRGKGVFRAFKDALDQHPEVEKQWFDYKEKEMRRAIIDWYNGLCAEWGIEKIGEEPEETDDLVREDFRLRAPLACDREPALLLHEYCLNEHVKNLNEGTGSRRDIDPSDISYYNLQGGWDFPGARALVAETAAGEFAAYICAVPAGKSLHIRTLQVKPEYRGIKLAEALLRKFVETSRHESNTGITIDIPAEMEGFAHTLLREGFCQRSTRWSLR